MNVFFLILPALALYILAQRFYAPRLARAFGESDARPTPAVSNDDGVDFVPTRPHVLFAHHFSAIAAAGPILGPTMAVMYGYLPAVFWIVLGAIFIGAVHDYACLYVSVREGGRSIAEIARRTMGTPAFVCYALFIVFNLVLVNAVFINTTAASLLTMRAPHEMGLHPNQTIFRTVPGPDGKPLAVVGGIASTSAIVLTLVAPALGYLVIRRQMRERFAYPIASLLCIGSVLVGFVLPVSPPQIQFAGITISPHVFWMICIALYVWLAAAVPVWLVLQPREFVSVQFLYLGVLLMIVAAVGLGFMNAPLHAPPAELDRGQAVRGWLWPFLFVTIACGAVSGFHGLVASGTTSKQVARESDARRVGYAGMLGESALALCVTIAVAAGMQFNEYVHLTTGAASNPILAFSAGVAGICEAGLGIPQWLGLLFGLLMVEGFVLDTLDVSIRLNRYLLEEIWNVLFRSVPAFLKNYWVNSGISVALMLLLAAGNTADALWPIFGSGNQLLAALSLVSLSLWFVAKGRNPTYVLLPAILIGVTTFGALLFLLYYRYLPAKNYPLALTGVAFIALALGVIAFAFRALPAARAAGRAIRRASAAASPSPGDSSGANNL